MTDIHIEHIGETSFPPPTPLTLVEVKVPGVAIPIKRFADAGLQAQIDAAVATLPDDAFVACVSVDQGGVYNGAFAVKIDNHWSIAVAGHNDWHGKWAAGGQVQWHR